MVTSKCRWSKATEYKQRLIAIDAIATTSRKTTEAQQQTVALAATCLVKVTTQRRVAGLGD